MRCSCSTAGELCFNCGKRRSRQCTSKIAHASLVSAHQHAHEITDPDDPLQTGVYLCPWNPTHWHVGHTSAYGKRLLKKKALKRHRHELVRLWKRQQAEG